MLLSFVKDDLPWLYELGVDAYQQTSQGTPNAKQARLRVLRALKMLQHGPWMEIFENKETHMLFLEMQHLVSEFSDMEESEVKRPRSKISSVKIGPPVSEEEQRS